MKMVSMLGNKAYVIIYANSSNGLVYNEINFQISKALDSKETL